MKRQFPILITFITAIIMIALYFLNPEYNGGAVKNFNSGILNWAQIIGAFGLLLGIMNLLMINFAKLRRGGSQAIFPLVLILSFLVTMISGIYDADSADGIFQWIFKFVFRPLQSTMFSLLAFYVASAAFRAFRAKTKEATLLLISAFIVMLGRVPIGAMIWGKIPVISNWIMGYPTLAAQTAIMIGAALGAVSVSIKIMLGIERTYLGGGE